MISFLEKTLFIYQQETPLQKTNRIYAANPARESFINAFDPDKDYCQSFDINSL